MRVATTVTLLLGAALMPAHAQKNRLGKDLTNQFKERRKHNAAAAAASSVSSEIDTNTNLRKGNTPDGSNAAATRLSLGEMAKVADNMKQKLEQEKRGEVKLKEIQKERFQKFIARYEELKSKNSEPSSKQQQTSVSDPANTDKLEWYKKNRHKMEFKETRGLVLGKTHEEREEVANDLREEIANHESGLKVMEEKLYEFKKHALLRYDRANHPELIKAAAAAASDDKEEETDDDKAATADEAIVSDGKTVEAEDPETFAAPPRKEDTNENDDVPETGVIVHGEEVKRRGADEAPKTKEEKDRYRKEREAGKKVSKILHYGGGDE
ncbi:hypothetical protein ACHAXN_005252 [Cyclotella atomus]